MFGASAILALMVDITTKALPHRFVVEHYNRAPVGALVAAAALLCVLGVWRSRVVAVGAGIMFGGLCGNAGQVLLYGYASDWLPLGSWLTNAADIEGAVGLVCCAAGYAMVWRRTRP
jgi:hypothetical protein